MRFHKSIAAAAVLLGVALFAAPQRAHAWSFYWMKVEVQAPSSQACMNFAYTIAEEHHLALIKRSSQDVTGNLNGNSATITCIGSGVNAKPTAVVMVVGDGDALVRQLRDDLAAGMMRMRLLVSNR